MKHILSIAGFDPSSGSGITRDLDIYFSLGLHGLSVPTCIVNQGPHGVEGVYGVPREQFRTMLTSIRKNVRTDGVKVGVAWDESVVDAIAEFLPEHRETPVVVDPVVGAKNGTKLLSEKGLKSLVKSLFPKATIVTPNTGEASAITGKDVKTQKDMEACAKAIVRMGPQAVVVKGGHLKGPPVDLLYDGAEVTLWKRKRIDREIHGTGCMFSSLLASFLVHGYSIKEAFLAAEGCVDNLLKESYRLSEDGYFYTSSGIINSWLAEGWDVIRSLKEAKEGFSRLNLVECIPEVQMNIGYALKGARGTEDVAAFPGRIGYDHDKVLFKGEPQFGASSHVARLILRFMRYFPHMRSAANVRCEQMFIDKARSRGLHVVFFDRRKEPEETREREGKSLDFLMEEVLRDTENPPDVIYDAGDIGKEPIIRLFARNPLELLGKMEMIAR